MSDKSLFQSARLFRVRRKLPVYPLREAIAKEIDVEYILRTNPPTTLVDAVLLYEYACEQQSKAGNENPLSPMSGHWWGARHAREQRQRAASLMFQLAHEDDAES